MTKIIEVVAVNKYFKHIATETEYYIYDYDYPIEIGNIIIDYYHYNNLKVVDIIDDSKNLPEDIIINKLRIDKILKIINIDDKPLK